MGFVIRQLKQGDAEAVSRLDQAIGGDDRAVTWDQYVQRHLAVIGLDSLIHPPWGCFAAESDRRIVGFLLSERQTPTYGLPPGARIVAMAVDAEFRRSGIGQRLIEALVEVCRRERVPEIYSVLRSEDEQVGAFLSACEFSDSDLQILSRKV